MWPQAAVLECRLFRRSWELSGHSRFTNTRPAASLTSQPDQVVPRGEGQRGLVAAESSPISLSAALISASISLTACAVTQTLRPWDHEDAVLAVAAVLTVTPGSWVSATIANFSAGVLRRRRSGPFRTSPFRLLLVIDTTLLLPLIEVGERVRSIKGRLQKMADLDRPVGNRAGLQFRGWSELYSVSIAPHGSIRWWRYDLN